MIKLSTGSKNLLVGSESIKDQFDGGYINLYSGSVPASADAAVTGTLITTIKNILGDPDDTLHFEATGDIADGKLEKLATETWEGTVGAVGSNVTITYARLVAAGDTGALSTSEPRLQGTVGTTTASDIQISHSTVSAGERIAINSFAINVA